jgi:hypothetical protein
VTVIHVCRSLIKGLWSLRCGGPFVRHRHVMTLWTCTMRIPGRQAARPPGGAAERARLHEGELVEEMIDEVLVEIGYNPVLALTINAFLLGVETYQDKNSNWYAR